MNKCKDCGLWEEDTPGYGICYFLIGALALGERIRFCQIFKKRSKLPIKNVDIVTCADFGCIHFEEKDKETFSIVKSADEGCDLAYWHLTFKKEKSPTSFHPRDAAVRWRDWLNELWAQREIEIQKEIRFCSTCKHDDEDLLFCGKHAFACGRWTQKEKEPPDKNCPDCTSFPCWTHQFFTGHDKFCCDKFERRKCRSCAHWVFKRHIHFRTVGKCKKLGHGFTNDDTCCREWAQRERELPDKNCRFECKTCSFWKDKHPFSDGVWGACECAEMKKSLPVHCGKAIAGGAFSDTKNCTLHTREDFGCNQWTDL